MWRSFRRDRTCTVVCGAAVAKEVPLHIHARYFVLCIMTVSSEFEEYSACLLLHSGSKSHFLAALRLSFCSFMLHSRVAMNDEESLDFLMSELDSGHKEGGTAADDCLERREERVRAVEEAALEDDGMPKKKRRKHRRCTESTAVVEDPITPGKSLRHKKRTQPEEAEEAQAVEGVGQAKGHKKNSKKKDPNEGCGTVLSNDPIVTMDDLLDAIDYEFGSKENVDGVETVKETNTSKLNKNAIKILCSRASVGKIKHIFNMHKREPLVVSGAALSQEWEEDQGDQFVWWNALLGFLDALMLNIQNDFEVDDRLYFRYYRQVRALRKHMQNIQKYLMERELFHFDQK